MGKRLLRRFGFGFITLPVILYLAFFGLDLAGLNTAGRSERLLDVSLRAVGTTGKYLLDRLTFQPQTYPWHRALISGSELIPMLFARSAALLLLAMAVAAVVGIPLGIFAARTRSARWTSLIVVLSLLGVSVPSFLLAMFLIVLNIQVHNTFDMKVLPATGFGYDTHLILPTLVLAARPLAQITQITYITFADILNQDYIRTARAKGVSERGVMWGHAIRNGIGPILTAVVSSLRFSLSSLPVVEYFFVYEGAGLILLNAIRAGNDRLAADLVLALAVFFLVVSLFHDLLIALLDPRARQVVNAVIDQQQPLGERLRELGHSLLVSLAGLWARLTSWLPGRQPQLAWATIPVAAGYGPLLQAPAPAKVESGRRRWRLRIRNAAAWLPVLLTTGLVIGFFGLALFGDRLTSANPYATSGLRYVDTIVKDTSGQASTKPVLSSPPFAPSMMYPWGSDPIGRDIQALVLAGAKQTLALALFGMLARVTVGVILGMISGWWHDSQADRAMLGLAEILAVFPTTLLAMILVLALGIRQGFSVFIIVLSIVGWSEITRLVRSKVMAIKQQPYIEGAVAAGGRSTWLLARHVLPNILPEILVLAALEMAGILMLLAELGFLNIFMGGGAQAQITTELRGPNLAYYYSDVPEWGALLSNIRQWWRSYPWMVVYPGLFFTAAILTFNLWGEALRGLLERIGYRMSRLVNRYTIGSSILLVGALVWVVNSTAPLGIYLPETGKVSAEHMLQDIRELSSPRYAGRETDTPGGNAAAQYIADRMQAIGLQPAGENDTYFHGQQRSIYQLTASPALTVTTTSGQPIGPFVRHRDYAEASFSAMPARRVVVSGQPDFLPVSEVQGDLLAVAASRTSLERPGESSYDWGDTDLSDKIVLVPDDQTADALLTTFARGILAVVDDPALIQRKHLLQPAFRNLRGQTSGQDKPVYWITQEVATRLLAGSGIRIANLRHKSDALDTGQTFVQPIEAHAAMGFSGRVNEETHERYYVAGSIPGTDSANSLDSQVILITASYDGLGQEPDGMLYPSANNNAAGVAAMLEIARIMKESGYQPRKTMVFVAWAGGNRYEQLSTFEVMNGKPGFNLLTVEAVLELRGVGSGTGDRLLIPEGSSYRLTELLRNAAGRVGIGTTTNGRDPNFGESIRSPSGGSKALTAQLSWDGSYFTSNLPTDTAESIDPAKLTASTKVALLSALVMSRHQEY